MAVMKKTLVLCPVYTEVIQKVNALPKGNESFDILDTITDVTGSGLAAACIFRGIGFPVQLAAPVGQGIYGHMVKEHMWDYGFDPIIESKEMSGSVLKLVDPQGREAFLSVPGAEFDYVPEIRDKIDADDIISVIVSGLMLSGGDGDLLVETLQELDKKTYFIPEGQFSYIDDRVADAIGDLHPVLIADEEEAEAISGMDTLNEAAAKLYDYTGSPVIVLTGKDGVYCYDGEESYIAESSGICRRDLFAGCLAAAENAGIDLKNSIKIAAEFAGRKFGKDPVLLEELKRRITDAIIHG